MKNFSLNNILNKLKNSNYLIPIVGFLIIAFFLIKLGYDSKNSITNFNSHPVVQQIKSITKLASLEIYVSDILVAENEYAKGIWIVKGDALLSTDLENSSFTYEEENKLITITLSNPKVTSPRVDHENSKLYSLIEKNNYFGRHDEKIEAFKQQALLQSQKTIEHAASQPKYLLKSKENIEEICRSFLSLSFPDCTVNIEWLDQIAPKSDFDENELSESDKLKT